jgi:hypothetical protein
MLWQLKKARQFTQFKQQLFTEFKPKILAAIAEELKQQRCEKYPNSDIHIQASQAYWGKYAVRILQAAMERELIDENWLKKTGNWRNSQHLLFIEQQFKAQQCEKIESEDN